MQGMILGAGFSTRLKPITSDIPKPLIPFFHRRLIDFQLAYLHHNRVESICINAHYHDDALSAYITNEVARPLTVFKEDAIRGTGGGILNMRHFISDDTFLVINCDFMCDFPLDELIARHRSRGALATMVLNKATPELNRQGYARVGIAQDQKLCHLPGMEKPNAIAKEAYFSGLHIFDRKIFDFMPNETFFCINQDIYTRLIGIGEAVYGDMIDRPWIDVGELRLYHRAHRAFFDNRPAWSKPLFSEFSEDDQRLVHMSNRLQLESSRKVFLGPQVSCLDPSLIGNETFACGYNTITAPVSEVTILPQVNVDLTRPISEHVYY